MEGTRDVQCSDVTDVNLRSSDGTRMLATTLSVVGVWLVPGI